MLKLTIHEAFYFNLLILLYTTFLYHIVSVRLNITFLFSH